jgi:hypothetical protein
MPTFASRLLLSAALVSAAGATALAQPSNTAPALAPTTAPQNADWSNVSNINGQLVPVGEKNNYLYEFKRTNISANPVGWIMGLYGVSASYALDDHLAIRGELDYWSPPDSNGQTMTEGDLSLPIYFRRTYQGAFIEPGVVVRQTQDPNYYSYDSTTGTEYTTTRTTSQFGPQVLVGWHWTWESGLNVAVAVGVGRNLNHDQNDYSSDPYIPNGYMRFGYAF